MLIGVKAIRRGTKSKRREASPVSHGALVDVEAVGVIDITPAPTYYIGFLFNLIESFSNV